MTAQPLPERRDRVLLGDEAVALAALDAGVAVAYAYPGTPSTEILEFLLRLEGEFGAPHAAWCVNEKTAFEQALGASMAGGRSLVAMKHVGLNVAADPFMNAALVAIRGGLVVAVADDPGMHSSQNEQDSRIYADFAHVPCFDPATQQEAYDMTREAFEVSERFHVPVVVRLVTRLAHGRAGLRPAPGEPPRPLSKEANPTGWVLLPANARRRWRRLLELQEELRGYSEQSAFNRLTLSGQRGGLGVITTGIARNYLEENLEELDGAPSHLHVGVYPWPLDGIRELADHVDEILVLEEGYSFLERHLKGLLPSDLPVRGKESGDLPADGELTPDLVRAALGLPARRHLELSDFPVPGRPPQLCRGCPHQDAFDALRLALEGIEGAVVPSDIGCYTLGALPPFSAIDSCVCMGASVGMAKGAVDAGLHPVVAVIGDSTFLHSGITPLIDATVADTDMTLLILDNEAVGMTGAQDTVLPASRLEPLLRGLGLEAEHLHVLPSHPKRVEEMAAVLRREVEHPGLSVVISVRECLEHARKAARDARKAAGP